jgi:heme exporter protein CcmD
MFGEYAPYVIGSYAITAGTIAALVAWVLLERRGARKQLEKAERAAARAREGRHAR